MNREYHKWFSHDLQREMELLVFGHAGAPLLVFPTSQGRFFEYEDRGMIGTVSHKIHNGSLQFYCVDSVDSESWYNRGAHPYWRVQRHMQYERYLLNDVLPLIRQKNSSSSFGTTGCSFGGYHAMTLTLRHPDIVTHCVTMGAPSTSSVLPMDGIQRTFTSIILPIFSLTSTTPGIWTAIATWGCCL
jgi:esterase/lipase superfamily enzyme